MDPRSNGVIAIAALVLLSLSSAPSSAQEIYAVTTVPDLADFVREIGGAQVRVESLANGTEDLHRVPARPSFLVELQRADIFFELGLDAEEAWVPALLLECRNEKIRPGAKGFVNCSWNIEPLEVPQSLSRAEGMLHPRGNPHFNVDPYLGRQLVINVAAGLIRAYPEHEKEFKANFKRYVARLQEKIQEWDRLAKPLRGKRVVSYHRAWVYLEKRYGFEVVGEIEPKPGIPPTPAHLASLEEKMREEKIQVILSGHYYSDRVPRSVAEETGAQVYVMALMVGGVPQARTYIDMVDYNLKTMLRAFDLPTELEREDGDG